MPWKIRVIFFPICLSILALLVLSAACARRDYCPPGRGTSADLQSTLALSLEERMKELPFDPAGKVIHLSVGVFGPYEDSLGVEGYVRSLFREWIIGRGGELGRNQYEMTVLLPGLGDTATRRDLSYQNVPLYYSERFRATVQLIVTVRDREGKIVSAWAGGPRESHSADVYLLRIFGPFYRPSPIQ